MFYWNRILFPRGMWYVMGTKTRVATDWGRSQGVYTSLRETARKLPKRLRDIPDKTAPKIQTESRETKLLYWTIKFVSHISLGFALLSFEALIWWFTFFFTIITTKWFCLCCFRLSRTPYANNTICLNKVEECISKTMLKAKVLQFKYSEITNSIFRSVISDTEKIFSLLSTFLASTEVR